MDSYSEDALVEQPAIALFSELGWETATCFYERFGAGGTLGRETPNEVVLVSRLRPALETLNPDLPTQAIDLAVEELVRDRSLVSPVEANREVYRVLKDGVRVTVPSEEGDTVEVVRVIDWNDPENNDFFLASQLWITGEMYKRRADLVGFVNGLPLLFVELKAFHQNLENAYRNNLRDYKSAIPQIFWHNALIVLSNGSESRVGSMSASWEHFSEWKRINSEGEEGVVSLETVIRGTCERSRLLDLVENFTLFSEGVGGLFKLVAKNHQYLGVNNAVEALRGLGDRRRLGVFWHTQGSGKSFSMVFFSQKVLRRFEGGFTFLIVTDRQELDDQIYKTFSSVGAVTEGQVQAENGGHLKQLLRENHRNVFTLIQKFRTEAGKKYPKLSDRSDIIVMTDEAHRTQYDVFALNMRQAMPNAAFIGFTGTPLMAGEERTKEVFGDYVSVYDFRQSVEDKATVPLYYENRIPELQLTNEAFNEDLQELIEASVLDEAQERRLERELGREYHLITREERLDKIAEDIVNHHTGQAQPGKAMVISIDKATAIRMYDKVQEYWLRRIEDLKAELVGASAEEERVTLREKIARMEETDMAVVVSQAQNEIEDMRQKGLDIAPHRERMVREDLETKFKDPDDPFRIVFVCAMWMTGFDVPSVSTIYLDKPMKNHTLMQTIARANRVFGEKQNGLIVDYVGIFRNLEQALAIYGTGGGRPEDGETPIKGKGELVAALRKAISEAEEFCREQGVEPGRIREAEGFQKIKLVEDAVEAILKSDGTKARFMALASNVERLHKAILPDASATEFAPARAMLNAIAEKIRNLTPPADISGVMGEIGQLLDRSIASEGYVVRETPEEYRVDLSGIDFEALRKRFEQGRKRTEAEKLRGKINAKLRRMVRLNKTRLDYLERFRAMIEAYNSGAINVQVFFEELVGFAKNLTEEEQRTLSEGLSEEELAVFDILTKPAVDMTEGEKEEVKKIARDLLETLKREKLVLDWRKRQQARASVRVAVLDGLDGLPTVYTDEMYQSKAELVYQHIYDHYYGQGRSVYAEAG
jgi:type I restriction enzyme R subunit